LSGVYFFNAEAKSLTGGAADEDQMRSQALELGQLLGAENRQHLIEQMR
jgi:hypothetical protein